MAEKHRNACMGCLARLWFQMSIHLVTAPPDLETTHCHHSVVVNTEHCCGNTFYKPVGRISFLTPNHQHQSKIGALVNEDDDIYKVFCVNSVQDAAALQQQQHQQQQQQLEQQHQYQYQMMQYAGEREQDIDEPVVDVERTVLDFFNSDLNLEISRDG